MSSHSTGSQILKKGVCIMQTQESMSPARVNAVVWFWVDISLL
jgi:hypothetical protein